ncbi:MAG: hypothetical protein AB1498_04330 [bacterium]
MPHFLSQKDADFFFAMEKIPEEGNKEFNFPCQGEKLVLPFTSKDKRELFLFDITRASIKAEKITYQNRARKSFVLRRLDIEGPSHPNPEVENPPLDILQSYNGVVVVCPHIHIYVEGFNHKWAVPIELFLNITNQSFYEIMNKFLEYCNVISMPKVKETLFI